VSAIENALKTDFSAYAVRVAQTAISNLTENTNDDEPVAIIRELLRSNVADIRQSANDANSAISMLQMFDAAATAISGKLDIMKELAEKTATGYYTSSEKVDMQQEFEGLATEINATANSTEYDGNKLFTSAGQTISLSLGNGLTTDIFAKDFSIDISGLNLATDAEGASAAIQNVITEFSEYSGYLTGQGTRLEDPMTKIDSDMAGAMDVDSSDFDINTAEEVVSSVAGMLLNDTSAFLDMQANVAPTVAGRLLEYRGV